VVQPPLTIVWVNTCVMRPLSVVLLVVVASCIPTSVLAVETQAHRGGRGFWPENTLAAFEGVLRVGVDV
jgi:glycerophosphoryl diester phosphodiesterase